MTVRWHASNAVANQERPSHARLRDLPDPSRTAKAPAPAWLACMILDDVVEEKLGRYRLLRGAIVPDTPVLEALDAAASRIEIARDTLREMAMRDGDLNAWIGALYPFVATLAGDLGDLAEERARDQTRFARSVRSLAEYARLRVLALMPRFNSLAATEPEKPATLLVRRSTADLRAVVGALVHAARC